MGIYSAFIEIQRELPPLVKDTQGHGYKYPTLNQLLDIVLPMCHKRGLGLIQVTHPVAGGGVGVETVIFNGENERLSSGILAMPLTTDQDGNIINVGGKTKQGTVSGQYGAQAYGSALTYARRYSLTAFFAMKAEDDDGYQASQKRNTGLMAEFDGIETIDAMVDKYAEMTKGKDNNVIQKVWDAAVQVMTNKGMDINQFLAVFKEKKGSK